MGRLIIEGNSVYEIDEECERQRNQEQNEKTQHRDSGHRRQNNRKNKGGNYLK